MGEQNWLVWLQGLTGASRVQRSERVQQLWSGYGELLRVYLKGVTSPASVIVKRVSAPPGSDIGHLRKLRSYEVERGFYQRFAGRCPQECRVPLLLGAAYFDGTWCLALEDLDLSGLSARWLRSSTAIEACISWLAHFHASFVGSKPEGLWPVGTYWHLATRPDELQAMREPALQEAAAAIDARLSAASFQTLVHGDAKVANFCFTEDAQTVAAVDFQYVGGGVGVKDLAYFLGSVLEGETLRALGDSLRDRYFEQLKDALQRYKPQIDATSLEEEWRSLYPWAWADFERFMAGWSPGARDQYTQEQLDEVLRQLGS